MTQSWVKPFYRKQFEWMNYEIDMTAAYLEFVQTVKEQVGKPFENMLDIGAGRGDTANVLAAQGLHVTTLELVPELVEFAKAHSGDTVRSLCGDFYTFELPETFDVVSYFDGFGIGADEDQRRLLRRIREWMKADGCALIDVYHPDYWKKVRGWEMTVDEAYRVYHYDDEGQRMLDTWWHPEYPEDKVTQSLRCYTTEEMAALCKQAGLEIIGIFPGGAMDFEEWRYHDLVSLDSCLSYRVKVRKVE